MKVPRKAKKRDGRGRKSFLKGPKKLNAWFSQKERADMTDLYERGKRLRCPYKFTKSLILREGSRMFIREQNLLMDKAEKGVLHAKPRPKRAFRFLPGGKVRNVQR